MYLETMKDVSVVVSGLQWRNGRSFLGEENEKMTNKTNNFYRTLSTYIMASIRLVPA